MKVVCTIQCPNSNKPNSQVSCHRLKDRWVKKSKRDLITCENPTSTIGPTQTTTVGPSETTTAEPTEDPTGPCPLSKVSERVSKKMAKIGSSYVFDERDFKFFNSAGIKAKLLCFNGRTTNKVKITCQAKKNGQEKWVIKGDPDNPPGNCHVTRKKHKPHSHW